MKVLVDAHVVQAFYLEDRGLGAHECSCKVRPVFDRFELEDELWLDSDGHIENEWRALVADDEWYEGWYFTLVAAGRAYSLPCKPHRELLARLGRDFSFPRSSGDRWFVVTAATLRDAAGCVPVIISEDMHLHEPRSKHLRGEARKKVIRESRGKMAAHLRRKESIRVCCAAAYLDAA
jgi:hypothetical protein